MNLRDMIFSKRRKTQNSIYFMVPFIRSSKTGKTREFPGGPVVRTLSFHCQGRRFSPWSGELRSHKPRGGARKKTGKTNLWCWKSEQSEPLGVIYWEGPRGSLMRCWMCSIFNLGGGYMSAYIYKKK